MSGTCAGRRQKGTDSSAEPANPERTKPHPATVALCSADLDCNTLVGDEDSQIFASVDNDLFYP